MNKGAKGLSSVYVLFGTKYGIGVGGDFI